MLVATVSVQQHHLTILGDRAAGKTHTLIDMAIDEAARRGGVVWYQCRDRTTTACILRDVVDRAQQIVPGMIKRVYRTNGCERIQFTSGGLIDFSITGDRATHSMQKAAYSMQRIGLHVMDDVPSEPYPYAARTVRAVLR